MPKSQRSATRLSSSLVVASPRSCVCNGNLVALVGKKDTAVIPVVLPRDAFVTRGNICTLRLARMMGADGFTHDPPVWLQGPHASTAADINLLGICPVMPAPFGSTSELVSANPDGRCNLLQFCNDFLAMPMASSNAGTLDMYCPLVERLCAITAENASGNSCGAVTALPDPNPVP